MVEEMPKTFRFREGEFLSPSEGGDVVRAFAHQRRCCRRHGTKWKNDLGCRALRALPQGTIRRLLLRLVSHASGLRTPLPSCPTQLRARKPGHGADGHSETHNLLHVRLTEASSGTRHDILFSDIYGEAFRIASDSADECRKIKILKRADHVAVLVDGKRRSARRNAKVPFLRPTLSFASASIRECSARCQTSKSY